MNKVPAVVAKYWKALADADGDTMAQCYAHKADFQDPVFKLTGKEAAAMWQMLFGASNDVQITTHPLEVDGDEVVGEWEAVYTFTATGRKVHNRIRSRFQVSRGKIVWQRDRFPFWKWSRMALGVKGTLLGWTPLVKGAVRKQARRRLLQWMME